MSRSNVETSKDAPIDAVGDDAVSNMLDVTGDQPSHQEWKNQFVQKTPFIALIVWVLGILGLVSTAGTEKGGWTYFKNGFSKALVQKNAFEALYGVGLLVCFPFIAICSCCCRENNPGPGRIFCSVVIVFV
eukprot:446353_1